MLSQRRHHRPAAFSCRARHALRSSASTSHAAAAISWAASRRVACSSGSADGLCQSGTAESSRARAAAMSAAVRSTSASVNSSTAPERMRRARSRAWIPSCLTTQSVATRWAAISGDGERCEGGMSKRLPCAFRGHQGPCRFMQPAPNIASAVVRIGERGGSMNALTCRRAARRARLRRPPKSNEAKVSRHVALGVRSWVPSPHPDDTMAVTTTCETTRWLSNDIFAVTRQTAGSRRAWRCCNADNAHYVKF